MLNMKKGLAVALAAATVLTFAPVNAFAGTTLDETTGSSDAKEDLLSTMNETANVWSFTYKKGKDVAADAETLNNLKKEKKAVVVLTPSNPTGSVTFTQPVTVKDADTLNNGKWFNYSTTASAASAWTAAKDNKEQNGTIELTAAKNGKTLNFKASMNELRALKAPEKFEFTATNKNATSLANDLKVTVILAPNAVKMNNLKVVLSQAGDSALNRYQNHDDDVYTAKEARPTGDIIGIAPKQDLKTKDDYDVALDGKRIDDQTINLAEGKDRAFKEIVTNADLEFKSDDDSIATVDKDGIHAKAVGETNVHISTKPTMTAYGVVSVDIHVKVVNIPKAKLTAPSDLTVSGYGVENSTAIGATGTNIQKNSIKYDFVWWDAINQEYVTFRTNRSTNASLTNRSYIPLNPFKLSDKQDSVYVESYTGDNRDSYDWNAYLKVEATGADGYNNPDPVYVKLHFNNTLFELDSYKQDLHIGESVQITAKKADAVSGAAFTYKSYNPAVATVSDKGVITAVSEGSTTVDVTYGGVTQPVKVTVKAYENGQGSTSAPEKVTGVKVSNKKGAKVSVNWTSQNGNVLYRVYKKVGSGKWIAKNVTSNKTTLSVKKGAKVTVKVKAFVKGADGKTVWGPKATSKSLKTDRK